MMKKKIMFLLITLILVVASISLVGADDKPEYKGDRGFSQHLVTLFPERYGFLAEYDFDGADPTLYSYAAPGFPVVVGQDLDPIIYEEFFRGFTEYSTSSIPDDAYIDSLVFSVFIPGSPNPWVSGKFDSASCDMDIWQMSLRPSSWATGNPVGTVGGPLFDDCGDGALYGSDLVSQSNSWYDITLSSTAEVHFARAREPH